MEITNINTQIAQALSSLSTAGNGDPASALKNRQAAITDAAASGDNQQPHALRSLVNNNFIKEQIEAIITSFPPYFPAGSPQRLDLIKGVKGVQEEIKSSRLPKEVKDKLAGQQLTDTSSDKEISAALQGVNQYTKEHSPSPAPARNNSQSGNIVSIAI